jgi:hypothetical protein
MFGAPGLFGSAILEVAIGLLFVYFILSLICSSVNEIFASLFKWRAQSLEAGLQNLLCHPEVFRSVMAHPLIKAMGNNDAEAGVVKRTAGSGDEGYAGKPSYIPARTFALALFDSLAPAAAGPITVARVRRRALELVATGDQQKEMIGRSLLALIEESRDPRTLARRVDDAKRIVRELADVPAQDACWREVVARLSPAQTLEEIADAVAALPVDHPLRQHAVEAVASIRAEVAEAAHDLGDLRRSVERWFDDAMERLSGVYKRRTQQVLLGVAVVVTLFSGADTLRMIDNLYTNPVPRSGLAAEAARQAGSGRTLEPSPSVSALVGELEPFDVLFGYGDMPEPFTPSWWRWGLAKLAGLPLTVLAISFGAPFWFDVLSKVVNVRGTGEPPDALGAGSRGRPSRVGAEV